MQKVLKQMGFAITSLVLALTTLVTVPVFAEHGSADTNDSTTTTQTDTSGSDDTNDTNTNEDTNTTPETESEVHAKGLQELQQLREQHKNNKSAEERTKTCESHKKGLETKFAAISKNADAFKTRIDDIYQKSQDYKTANNLSPANWDSLTAAADTAKQNAADAITTLKAVSPSLDCTSPSAAQEVATFKVAAKNTRDALKTYKQAVKAVIKSLLDLKATTDNTTDNNTTDNTTIGGTQ